MSLGRLSPPFLYSFSLLSKTATSSLFVIHFTEISPSTSEKHRFLQYSSPANHDSQPYSARHIPSFGGAWEGSLSLFLYSSPLPYKTATSSPFNCSSLRNKPFHTWGTPSSVVLFNTKPPSPTPSRQAHPLLRRGLGRLSFHFSNISVHSPTRSQILKIWAHYFSSKYPFFVLHCSSWCFSRPIYYFLFPLFFIP